MKQYIFLLIVVFISYFTTAQVGINTENPNDAAAFEINSETPTMSYGGLKLPVVTEAQRNSIAVTAASEGTMVYVTHATESCLEIYDGLQNIWQKIRCTNDSLGLFISEYVEGSNLNKFIELYNPTSSSIDLSAYKILILRDGGTLPIDGTDREVFLTGTIAPLSTFVIANASADVGFYTGTVGQSVPSTNFDFGGDDPVILADLANNTIDIIGIPGTDPGDGYSVDGSTTENETIRRIPTVQEPNSTWTPLEWSAFGSDTASGLGNY